MYYLLVRWFHARTIRALNVPWAPADDGRPLLKCGSQVHFRDFYILQLEHIRHHLQPGTKPPEKSRSIVYLIGKVIIHISWDLNKIYSYFNVPTLISIQYKCIKGNISIILIYLYQPGLIISPSSHQKSQSLKLRYKSQPQYVGANSSFSLGKNT